MARQDTYSVALRLRPRFAQQKRDQHNPPERPQIHDNVVEPKSAGTVLNTVIFLEVRGSVTIKTGSMSVIRTNTLSKATLRAQYSKKKARTRFKPYYVGPGQLLQLIMYGQTV